MMSIQLKTPILERSYSSDEFENMPEFDERFELVEGRLVKKPMHTHKHSWIADIIREHYRDFDPGKKFGQMLQEVSVELGPGNVLIPDISFWTAARRWKQAEDTAAPIPDLAIEIWSEHDWETKKRQDEARSKIRRYQAAGVSLIWIINSKSQTVEVYHTDPNTPLQTFKVGDELSGEEVIPGFKLKVAEIFE